MDAVEFVKEFGRMCRSYTNGCEECALYGKGCTLVSHKDDPETLIEAVKKWSDKHPRKTRQSVFLEQWPDARVDKTTGVLTICPAELTKECRDDRDVCGAYSIETGVCNSCRREFWMQEVE